MANPNDFAQYVQSVTSLDALEKMTDDMDKDIEESQNLMDQIKTIFDSFPNEKRTSDTKPQHEDVSNFLDAEAPQLLMDDMTPISLDIDLEPLVNTMKNYIAELKREFVNLDIRMSASVSPLDKDMSSLDLNYYANSLEQLRKKFENIKLTTQDKLVPKKDPKLEDFLTRLSKDVNNFFQMVQVKTRVTECNKQWPRPEQDIKTFEFNEIVSQFLSLVTEVTYLLQNNKN